MNNIIKRIKSIKKDDRGAAALLMIIIIGVASLIMATSASRLGLGELEMGYDEGKGSAALSLADGCAEEALERLRKNSAYAGGTLSVGAGSCMMSVSGSGSSRIIDSSATIGSYTKKIELQITINSSVISITSWSEVSP